MKRIPPFYFCLLACSLGTLNTNAQKTYAIDINDARDVVTPAGWENLPNPNSTTGGSVLVDGITFRIGSADGSRVRGGSASPNPNALTADFAFDDGPGEAVVLFFGGAGDLAAGDWLVEVWSHESAGGTGNQFLGLRTNTAETMIIDNLNDTVGSDTVPSHAFSFNSDGTSAYDVFVRENSDTNRSRLNAVRLTRLGARAVQLDPPGIPNTSTASSMVSTFTPIAFPVSSAYTYSLVTGEGDTHNSEFTISGDQLLTSATFPGYSKGEVLSIRIRAVDAETGVFEGIIQIPVIVDTDSDGLDDDWERSFFTNNLTIATGNGNNDSDLLTNIQEFLAGTNPTLTDTDNDGLDDDVETNDGIFVSLSATGTDPNLADTDGDGLNDGDEINATLTDPFDDDTDDDGLNDGDEIANNSSPFLPDTDGDGIGDLQEVNNSTDPADSQSPSTGSTLAAYWPLDLANELAPGFLTTPDLSGNSYDMELVNMGTANFVNEEGRQSASFNGTDQLLRRIHDPADALPINQHPGYTVSMWVKATGTGQSDRRFFSEGSTTNGVPLFNMGTQNAGLDGRFNLYNRSSGAPLPQFSNGTPMDGTWRHVALTSNAFDEKISFYIDGVLDRDDFIWRDLSTQLNVTSIGAIMRENPSHWINGFVDDVALWNKTLSPAEIAELAAGTSPLTLGGGQAGGIIVTATYLSDTGTVELMWNSQPGMSYTVRSSPDLSGDPSTWTLLDTNLPSGGTTTSFNDTTSPLPAKRFYVVEESP